jgi:hypothetical protein
VEEARSKLRDENTRITVRAERAKKALQAFKEAKAEEITCSICNEPLESRPTTYVTCGFFEDTLNQSLVEDTRLAKLQLSPSNRGVPHFLRRVIRG